MPDHTDKIKLDKTVLANQDFGRDCGLVWDKPV